MRRRVMIIGSTGSIGTQALDLIAANPDRFEVVGLGAGGSNPGLLIEQARRFGVRQVAVASDPDRRLSSELGRDHRVVAGPEACAELACGESDIVLNAMTGAVGLPVTVAALQAGRTVGLANKESLVIGGPVVTDIAAPGQLVPVDSEHTAIAQCLRAGSPDEVRRLVVTASGGPFRGRTRDELGEVTVEQALAHPNWSMGPVITINSATLVNKGLEVIEAHLLFGIEMDRIDVVVHPQSRVHSMVEFCDGATIAQASPPSMLEPIAMALAWPGRIPDAQPTFDWTRAQEWTFEPLDDENFPAVRLARRAGSAGGIAPAVYNAANEEGVRAFREGRLPFVGIVDVIAEVLAGVLEPQDCGTGDVGLNRQPANLTLADVLKADSRARAAATDVIATY